MNSSLGLDRSSFLGVVVIGLALGGTQCGGGGASKGGAGGQSAGGQSAGGQSAGGTTVVGGGGAGGAGVVSGAGGAPPTMGRGIPASGDASCLLDAMTADGAFVYGYARQCATLTKKGGVATSEEKAAFAAYCALRVGGMMVASCPADPAAAYCVDSGTVTTGSITTTVVTVPFDLVRVVYQSAVTPDAQAVARNSVAICGVAPAIYDATTNQLVAAKCSGTLTASVDGVPVDFSQGLFCSYSSDGPRGYYFIRGSDVPASIAVKTLSLSIYKNATGVSLQTVLGAASPPSLAALYPPVGYSEGTSASGAFATPTDPTTITYQSQTYDATGASVSGTFTIGGLKGGAGTRTITAGTVNIAFPTN